MVKRTTWRLNGGLARRMSAVILVFGLLTSGLILEPGRAAAKSAVDGRFDHGAWDKILSEYVDEDGLVAYKRLGDRDREQLEAYLARIGDADPQQLGERERLAFWINAYNAGIVSAVLQGYSPESTLSRARMFRWYTFRVAGKERTPDEVEHEILRKQFSEPRIHFALVCAATSCPMLRREAYRGDVFDRQVDDQAKRFINDRRRNRIDPDTEVKLSRIFDWFESDFTASGGTIADFVARYVEDEKRAVALRGYAGRIEFLEYDWTLNAQAEGEDPERGAATRSVDAPQGRVCAIDRRLPGHPIGEPGSCAGA